MITRFQQIKIARFHGYRVERVKTASDFPYQLISPEGYRVGSRWATEAGAWSHGLPGYDTDLNAVRDVQNSMTPMQKVKLCLALQKIVSSGTATFADCIFATAEQHCEAILKLIEKEIE